MNVRTIVVSVISALAAIGLVSMMITSPGQLVRQMVFAVVTVALVLFLFRVLMKKRVTGNNEDRAYTKAVKQSKKRQNSKTSYKVKPSRPFSFASKPKRKPSRRKKASHLTVIDGNKGKRGSRASSE